MVSMYKITGRHADGVKEFYRLTLSEALASAVEIINDGGVAVEIICPYGTTYDDATIRDMNKKLHFSSRPFKAT